MLKYLFLVLIFLPSLFEIFLEEHHEVVRFAVYNFVLLIFLLVVYRKKLVLEFNSFTILVSIFYSYNLVQVFFFSNRFDAIYDLEKISIFIIGLILLSHFLSQLAQKQAFYQLILCSSSIVIVYAAIQFLDVDIYNRSSTFRIRSFFEHKNVLAEYLFLCLPFLIFGLKNSFEHKNKLKLLAFFSVIVSTLILIFLLQTRAIILSLFITSIILLIFFGQKLNIQIRIKYIFIILATIILLITFFNSQLIDLVNIESLAERTLIWKKTIQLINDNLLFGVGPGNWKFAYMQYGISEIENISQNHYTFQKPHNDFLWILAENGIIGFMLVVFAISLLVYKYIKTPKLEISATTKVLVAFLLGFLIDCFFGFPKEKILSIILVSIYVVLISRNLKFKKRITQNHQIISLILFVVLIFNSCVSFYRIKGEFYTKQIYKNMESKDFNSLIENADKAKSNFYQTDLNSIPIAYYEGFAYSQLHKLDKVFICSKQAFELCPYNFEVINNYAYVLMRFNQLAQAKRLLYQSYKINSKYEKTCYNLCILNYNLKLYREAKFWSTKIQDFEIKYGTFNYQLQQKLMH